MKPINKQTSDKQTKFISHTNVDSLYFIKNCLLVTVFLQDVLLVTHFQTDTTYENTECTNVTKGICSK